ncbi:GNAT family N-acetyltransferase [bacterium]|nr:GNAT family N-acetyltransferase [bacterium]RQV97210.1 MAG: GNAT family N-acetyltransferase [bacterium]
MRYLTLHREALNQLTDVVFDKNGILHFIARGQSMHPFIHHGDVIFIKSIENRKLVPGDILFYRYRNGKSSVHRLTGIVLKNSMIRYIVCGDAHPFSHECLNPDQILGRVFQVKRQNKTMDYDRGIWRFAGRIWICLPSIVRRYVIFLTHPSRIGLGALNRLQKNAVYRIVMRSILYKNIRICDATDEDIPSLVRLFDYQRYYSDSDAVMRFREQFRHISQTGCILIAKYKDNAAGAVVLERESEQNGSGSWWMNSLFIRRRYRKIGIARALMHHGFQRIIRESGSSIHFFLFRDNIAGIRYYEKMGFKICTDTASRQLFDEESSQEKRPRIVMSLELSEASRLVL